MQTSRPRIGAHRAPSSARRRALLILLIVASLVSVSSTAWAYWRSTGTGTGTATTGTLTAPTNVAATATPGAATVAVSWTASTVSPSGAPAGYYVTRITNSTSASTAACGTSSAALTSTTACTDSSVSDGSYHYLVTAVYRSWTTVSAASNTTIVSAAKSLSFTAQPTNTTAGTSITPAVAVTVLNATGQPVLASGISVTRQAAATPLQPPAAGWPVRRAAASPSPRPPPASSYLASNPRTPRPDHRSTRPSPSESSTGSAT
jgi:hypothetical protein